MPNYQLFDNSKTLGEQEDNIQEDLEAFPDPIIGEVDPLAAYQKPLIADQDHVAQTPSQNQGIEPANQDNSDFIMY